MVVVKWEPFRDLMAMQERMTRLLDETLSRVWREEDVQKKIWSPAVDILERKNDLLLKIDVSEVNQDEIDIKVQENNLIVQGERTLIKGAEEETFLQIERPYGTFYRSFTIPRAIDQQGIKASYKDGVLLVVLPKKEKDSHRQISVEAK
jgi:HSP20 family protein